MEMNNDIFTPDLPIPEPVSFEDAPIPIPVEEEKPGVAHHQYQRLVIHPVQNVVHTPARRTRYLPHEAERAMGGSCF